MSGRQMRKKEFSRAVPRAYIIIIVLVRSMGRCASSVLFFIIPYSRYTSRRLVALPTNMTISRRNVFSNLFFFIIVLL